MAFESEHDDGCCTCGEPLANDNQGEMYCSNCGCDNPDDWADDDDRCDDCGDELTEDCQGRPFCWSCDGPCPCCCDEPCAACECDD